jgi:putative methyltransferase
MSSTHLDALSRCGSLRSARLGRAAASAAHSQMAKRKAVPILKREREAPRADGAAAKRRRRAAAGPPPPRPPPRAAAAAAEPAGPPPPAHWFPAALIHRQAAAAVERIVRADATHRGGASLKSLTLAPGVVNKRAVHAVAAETLRALPLLRRLLAAAGLDAAGAPRLPPAAGAVLARELLWGGGLRGRGGAAAGGAPGPAERAVLAARPALRAALAAELAAAGAARVEELLPAPPALRPRAARVNELRGSVAEALAWLRAPPAEHAPRWAALGAAAEQDPVLPEVLLFPPGADLHDHPLVLDGRLVLQSRASCMPARALAPPRGAAALDACAAPGNKTTHLAALVGAAGRVLAFDRDPARLALLRAAVARAGADGIVAPAVADFLALDPAAPEFAGVRYLLLDPSCSGSGTAAARAEHLLPSAHAVRAAAAAAAAKPAGADDAEAVAPGDAEDPDAPAAGAASDSLLFSDRRVRRLAAFQLAALRHALAFPAAARVAYSTCSVHAAENEGVVAAVLADTAVAARGWALARALPAWPRRGAVVAGALGADDASRVARADPDIDGTDGFFVAVFERRGAEEGGGH